MSDSRKFDLNFNNPCIDTEFVNILPPNPLLQDQDYIIHATAELFPVHEPFKVSTVPIGHEFCGDLTIVAKFNDFVIDGNNSDPLTYNEANRQFTAFSDNADLILDIIPYSLEAEFKDYPKRNNPTVSTAETRANVEFDNPCW